MGRRLGWLCAAMLAASMLAVPGSTLGQEGVSSSIREGFESTRPSEDRQSFAERYPEGKLSVVESTIDGTDSLLTTAHRLALRHNSERSTYREALVYQCAARSALDDEQFVEALYLTYHARTIGRGVLLATMTRLPEEYQPDNLEVIMRAGKVDPAKVDAHLRAAEEEALVVEFLFVE